MDGRLCFWKEPDGAEEIMRELRVENEDLYRFEEMLEIGELKPDIDRLNMEE